MLFFRSVFSLFLLSLFACAPAAKDASHAKALDLTEIETVDVTIDYMEGARPVIQQQTRPFALFRNNMNTLFRGSSVEWRIPEMAGELREIPAGPGTYTREEILDLARKYRGRASGGRRDMEIYVLFVNGHLSEKGMIKKDVVGTSSRPENVIAVFMGAAGGKPALDSESASFFQQMILIHEAGHLLGLVGEGVPLTSDHLDPDHVGHCSNPKCIMHYKMEVGMPLLEHMRTLKLDPTTSLFGPECLADFRGFTAGNTPRIASGH